MKQPISIFIMDVTNSSSKDNWIDITEHLQYWKNHIEKWCKDILPAQVTHRRGDEILFVGQHYFSAYTIANQISQYWKYTKQMPYFGLSHGHIDENIAALDIEIWNHPMIKKARLANERLKKRRQRETDMYFSDDDKESDTYLITTAQLLNLLLEHQYTLRQEHSVNQKLICALYSIFDEQKQIAHLIKKTQPTISTHFNRGHCELLNKTSNKIQKILSQDEMIESKIRGNMLLLIQDLNNSIRENLLGNISELYPQFKQT